MAPKRPLEDDVAAAGAGAGAGAPEAKKPKKGFRVGPENLPDGPWKRKSKIWEHIAYALRLRTDANKRQQSTRSRKA